ncbi:aminoglycoside adenylyltransferase domain-containing protein [Nocardia cyriacigeorgica]|uniref:aminoglycoside adenylyltransferase domain-containing protein n=1 Tax=Nocardia cyriacigeorgica TaxID=135487 RepID=UPI002458ED80|nr:aminoglycoside adenylyltransferase domain-containing protein [Nocardia cyriacigeorgica]
MTHPAPSLARAAAARLAESCSTIVGDATRSVILHGSLATGEFRPQRSDIDLLMVSDTELTDDMRAALERSVREADIGPAGGIDLHVVLTEAAAAPTRTPPAQLHVGRYDGSSLGVEVQEAVPQDPDLPAELSMVRQNGIALLGRPPSEVIGPVPPEWIVERGRYWLQQWRTRPDDAESAALMVLTACRVWHFAHTNRHAGKAAAARWALEREPSATAVRQALQQYLDDPAASIDPAGIARVMDIVLDETG